MSYEAKLKEMGYTLETIEMNTGRFLHAVQVGNIVYTSGQVSAWGGKAIKGKIGQDLSVEEGYEAAKMSALNCLQAVHTLTGSIDNIKRVVKLLGMVNVGPGFDDTPSCIHGASDLMLELFGEAGKHARSAVGMTIPFDFAIEVEAIFAVK